VVGDGTCFSISRSTDGFELMTAPHFGSGVFSASVFEGVEEREVVESSVLGEYRVEWMDRLTSGEDSSSSSSLVNHVIFSVSTSVRSS
jgi:hypothetical protein